MRAQRVLIRSSIVAAMSLLLVAGSAVNARVPAATAAGGAAQPAGLEAVDPWGWVTLRDKTAATQPQAPYDQGNFYGLPDAVTYNGSGRYLVSFGGLGTSGGIANVTTLGNGSRICDIVEWGQSAPISVSGGSTDEIVTVQCWNRLGYPASATFMVTFVASTHTSGRLAYLWAGDWTRTNYTPDAEWNYNSAGSLNTIHRNGLGDYRVTLPGLASAKGNVQIGNYFRFVPTNPTSPQPSGSTSQVPTECNVASWGAHNADMRIRVLCRGLNGHLIDTQFELTFTQGMGLKGHNGHDVAYVFANKPGASSYTPASSFRYATPNGSPTVKRSARGTYSASLPSMPKGGAAIVTAYGTGRVRCNVLSVSKSNPETIGVRCEDFTGRTVDSKFTLSYLH